jgi:hypothetical protein
LSATLVKEPQRIGDNREVRHVHDLQNAWRQAVDAANHARPGATRTRLTASADRAYEEYLDAEAAETYRAYRRLMGMAFIGAQREA